jgi:hypothetical protein
MTPHPLAVLRPSYAHPPESAANEAHASRGNAAGTPAAEHDDGTLMDRGELGDSRGEARRLLKQQEFRARVGSWCICSLLRLFAE